MCCRYLHALTDYYHISPHLKPENFPKNDTTSGLAQGLAQAHNAYGVQRYPIPCSVHSHSPFSSAYILFVIQPNERNVFDQRWLEYELLEKCVPTHHPTVTAAHAHPPDTLSVSSAKHCSSSRPPHRSPVPPAPSSSHSLIQIPTRSRYQRSTSAQDTSRPTFPSRHTGRHVSPSNEAARSSVRLYPFNLQAGKRYRKH